MRWLLAVTALIAVAGVAVLTASLASGGRRAAPAHPGAGDAPAPGRPAPRPPRRPRRPPPRPPQFVVVSFDGAGGAPLWRYWRGVARQAHARFTFFVSGAYLLDWDNHADYAPPRAARGTSAIGFAPDARWITAMRAQVALGFREGHEIGTHYTGHFCGAGGVATWTAADWRQELAEFDLLVFRGRPRLTFGPRQVVGSRTPCLEGNLDLLYPLLARRGFRYDASRTAPLGAWPSKKLGLWSLPLLELPFPGHTYRVLSMDYNFLANQGEALPGVAGAEMSRTYWDAFRTIYLGNRAPLSLGSHFQLWKDGAYDRALAGFLVKVCRLPEVRCATAKTLVAWLDRLTPRQLRRYRAGRFPIRALR